MILVPVLHFSRLLSSFKSSCSVLNMEYLSIALRLLSLAVDTTRSCEAVKGSKFVML